MLLVVGLGNPGPHHARNRHNIGFLALDAVARHAGAPAWRRKFQGDVTEATLGDQRALLLKPLTYMNDSGRAVAEAARFHKVPVEAVTVLHDELGVAPARLRVKRGGGDAGHNGLRSITAALGPGYRRVRLGIGRPPEKPMVHDYVLSDFAKAEAPWVEDLLDAVARGAARLAAGDDAGFEAEVAAAMGARGHDPVKTAGGRPSP